MKTVQRAFVFCQLMIAHKNERGWYPRASDAWGWAGELV